MNGASPEEPKLPIEASGAYPSRGQSVPRGVDGPPEHQAQPENPPDGNRPADEDEILRSGRGETATRGAGRSVSIEEQPRATGVSEERRMPKSVDNRYAGWLPTGRTFTGGEVAIAAFIAEALVVVSFAMLALAERWGQLPASVVGNEISLALSIGIFCGLYVLLQLRARRLAWRRQLEGEGP